MSRRSPSIQNRLLPVLDILIILASVLLSRVIRSQFPYFLYELEKMLFMLPYVVVARLLVNLLFEHYQSAYRQILSSDVRGLFVHQLAPTALLILLRFVSPFPLIRVPLSMIISEYFITVSGFVMVRLLFSVRPADSQTHHATGPFPSVAVLSHDGPNHREALDAILQSGVTHVVGIISDRLELWSLDIAGARVIGGPDVLPDVLRDYPHARMILLPGTGSAFRREVLAAPRGNSLVPLTFRDGVLTPTTPGDLFERIDDPNQVISERFDGPTGSFVVISRSSSLAASAAELATMLGWNWRPLPPRLSQARVVDLSLYEPSGGTFATGGPDETYTEDALVVVPALAGSMAFARRTAQSGATVLLLNPLLEDADHYGQAKLLSFSFLETARSAAIAIFESLHSQRGSIYRYVGQDTVALSEYIQARDLLRQAVVSTAATADEEIDVTADDAWTVTTFPTLWRASIRAR